MKRRESMNICDRFAHVFRAGYCDLQDIFKYEEPTYYNCGVYGWNNDSYIDYETNTIITTGYRNMRGALIDRDIIEEYSRRARAIAYRRDNFDAIMEDLAANRRDFIKAITA